VSRFLALDWDHQQLHIVAAEVRQGAVRIERTAFTQETQSPNPAEAETLGKLLRDRLKQAAIAPAPVLACIGRDRVVVKEVRYPVVQPSEEPAVVRFQVVKELSDRADEVVIDYVPLPGGDPKAEKRALAFIVRSEILDAYRTLCKAAGLKLHALTPRPFGIISSLRANGRQATDGESNSGLGTTCGVVTLAPRWSEFCVAEGNHLLLARTLGDKPVEEVRRHLTVFNSNAPAQNVKALYLINSDGAEPRDLLYQALQVPVVDFDPLAGLELPTGRPRQVAGFAGAVGLLRAHAAGKLPVNFVAPKRPVAAKDSNKLRVAVAASVLAALILAAVVYGVTESARNRNELVAQRLKVLDLDAQLTQLEADAKAIDALKEWTGGEINVLDELYDLTDRFPSTETMRLTLLNVMPLGRSEKKTDKHVARINLKGVSTDDIRQVDELLERMNTDGYYRVDPKQVSAATDADKAKFTQQFNAQADVEQRRPASYARQLPASLETASTEPAAVTPAQSASPAVASQTAPAADPPKDQPAGQQPAVNAQPAEQSPPPGGGFRRARRQPKMIQGSPK
jgi:hypothetical protein